MALERLNMGDRDYGWTIEMQVKAARARLRVAEVAVSYRPRIGQSKVSGTLAGSVRAGVKILYVIFRQAMLALGAQARGGPRDDAWPRSTQP
ncbi:MAG: hypothetical protein U1E76_22635 [Planctomycetota bacterium]